VNVTNNYSGQLLSEVPYPEIHVGMKLISEKLIVGEVVLKIDEAQIKQYGKVPLDNWLRIKWKSGREIARPHRELNNIKVK
jgi:hypothetical protein